MPKISKRAWWGYTPASVDEVVEALHTEHEKRCAHLQAQLDELIGANEQLRAENAKLLQESQAVQRADENVAAMFLQAHVEQTKAVYDRLEELKQIDQKQDEVLEISQLHRESVMNQVLGKLRGLESDIQFRAKEGEHGGSSGL